MAAANKMNSKKGPAMEVPECPVCLETMTAPIYQCKTGHSICSVCTKKLLPPICPECRQDMTQMRNLALEVLVAKAKVSCPNKSSGCVFTMPACELEDHLKECIFRTMDCPLGVVFGKCSWNGSVKEMLDHFKERHPANCDVSSDSEIQISIKPNEDERFVYLTSLAKFLFILTLKVDTLQKMAYWTIQHIGSKKAAQQHVYEIHVISKTDDRRKAVFIDHCFNDAMKTDEVFRNGKCAMMPLDMFKHFIKDKKITFRFFIKRIPPNNPPQNKNNPNDGNNPNNPNNPNNKPKGPKPVKKQKQPQSA